MEIKYYTFELIEIVFKIDIRLMNQNEYKYLYRK